MSHNLGWTEDSLIPEDSHIPLDSHNIAEDLKANKKSN